MSWHARVVRNRYVDSVRLMAVAQSLRERDGVAACEVLTGTPANLEQLAARGLAVEAAPTDVVVAVDAAEEHADAALAAGEQALAADPPRASGEGPAAAPPRTLSSAARALGGANVALISVPGEYAALEAHRALTEGMHAFLFSDHVSLADELALKRRGAERGLLVMGPGCGTAMLGGVGLGFANVVPSGPVGVVAAAGTGAQEVAVLLAGAGVGVSQIVGVGGRDLHAEIDGIMFRAAMRTLAQDDETETLLLVSKPPSREAVQKLGAVDVRGKRVVAAFVGWEGGEAPFEIHPTLDAGAFAAAGVEPPRLDALEREADAAAGRGRHVLGLYSGGSLAHEAVTLLEPVLGPVGGNAGHGEDDEGHAIFDLGEEEYTQGRPHPMVDLETRLGFLRERAAREDVACVLLDVVLGHGSHPDPAGGLAPQLAALARDRVVIAHVCGTELDPQDARRQERTLRDAGVLVAPTNAAAARLAARVALARAGTGAGA
jgi:FdrA protein